MEEALRATLLGTAALTALVQRRVDWDARPQGNGLPSLTLQLISGVPRLNIDGPAAWTRARVQIDTWGRTHKEARDIADLLAGKPGTPGVLHGLRTIVGSLRLRTFILSRRGGTDTDANDKIIHRASIDVLVWYA